jgi:hypothetical protein
MMIKLYIDGICILLVAILANLLASKLELKSWYGFLMEWSEKGGSVWRHLLFRDWLWLFLVYPILLGLAVPIGQFVVKLLGVGKR